MGHLMCQYCVSESDTGNLFANHIMLSCIAALVPVCPLPTPFPRSPHTLLTCPQVHVAAG